jgi:hypothetical protein
MDNEQNARRVFNRDELRETHGLSNSKQLLNKLHWITALTVLLHATIVFD